MIELRDEKKRSKKSVQVCTDKATSCMLTCYRAEVKKEREREREKDEEERKKGWREKVSPVDKWKDKINGRERATRQERICLVYTSVVTSDTEPAMQDQTEYFARTSGHGQVIHWAFFCFLRSFSMFCGLRGQRDTATLICRQ